MAESAFNLDDLMKTATAAPPSTAYVGDTIKRVRDLESQRDTATAPIRDKLQRDFETDRREVEAKTPAPADFKPWTAKPPETDPIQAFGSFGSIFGILASAFTHQPWQSSMNAATAAVNAVKTNDAVAYKDAYEAWKDNTSLMLKRHDEQYKDFQAAMEKMKTDTVEGNAMLQTMSAKYGDQITDAYREAGLQGDLVKIWEARQKAALGIMEVMPRIEEQNMQVTAVHGLQKAREDLRQTQQVGDPQQIEEAQRAVSDAEQGLRDLAMAKYPSLAVRGSSVSGQKAIAIQRGIQEYRDANDGKEPDSGALAEIIAKANRSSPAAAILDADTLTSMADQYLAGDKTVVQGLGYGNVGAENRAKLRTEIQKLAKDRGMSGTDIATKMAEFEGLKAGERAVGTRVANVSLAVNEARQLIPPALEASKNLSRGEFLPFNQLQLSVQRGTSSVPAAQLVAATNSLVNVYVRAISPTGVPTDILRQHAYALLDAAQSPEVYAGVIKQLQIEMDAAMRAPADVKQELSDLAAGKPKQKGSGASAGGGSAESKTIGGKTYVKKDGQWFPQEE